MEFIATHRIPLAASEADRGFSWLPDFFSFVKRSKYFALGSAIAFVLLVGLYCALATPKYVAVAEILVDAQSSDPFKQIPISVGDSSGASAFVDSQMEILLSHGIMERVARSMNLKDDPVFQSFGAGLIGSALQLLPSFGPAGPPATEAQQMERTILAASRLVAVRRIGVSYVLQITTSTPDAAFSAKLANAVADAYLREQVDAKRETAAKAETWLADGITRMRDQALAADRALLAFRAANQIVNLDKMTLSEQQLADLQASVSAARNHLAEATARSQQIDVMLERGIGDASVSDAVQNPVIVRLRQQYLDAAKRLAELSERYGPDHMAARRAKQDMDSFRAAGFAELQHIAEGYRSDLEVAKANAGSLEENHSVQVQRTLEANNLLAKARDLETSAATYRTLYQNFLQRYTQALQDQGFPLPQARVFTAATPSLKPSWPMPALLLGLGAVLGGGFGLGLGFVRESFQSGLRTAADVNHVTGFDCLALFPNIAHPIKKAWTLAPLAKGPAIGGARSDMARLADTQSPLLWQSNVPPGLAQGLQAIRARLMARRHQSIRTAVIGITSTVSGEGKTTVAVNLAQFLAECRHKTILIDWDLHTAGATTRLRADCPFVWRDMVSGKATIDDLIMVDEDSGLHILAAKPVQEAVTAGIILGSEAATNLIEDLRLRYDYIIVDLPAALSHADAQLIRPLIDSSLYVIEANATESDLVEECLTRGAFDPSGVLGVVLNKMDPKSLARYA